MTSQLIKAFETQNLYEFLHILMPTRWHGVAARIIESGASLSYEMCDWAPRWSEIPPTIKYGDNELETAIKSCIFRMHDSIHQLWGLPTPSSNYDESDFYLYKRAQMCGEVAVLTLIEFNFCRHLCETFPETKEYIYSRNALPMADKHFANKTTLQIALRLDDILHKQRRPKWLRDCQYASAFADDYVPMLELDRKNIDANWCAMTADKWLPTGAPNSRYSSELDGLELTSWMINDFSHLCDTDSVIDNDLAAFNRNRRSKIILPAGWNPY